MTETDIGDLFDPVFLLLRVFVLELLLNLLVVLLIEVVVHDLAQDFFFLPLVLAHQ